MYWAVVFDTVCDYSIEEKEMMERNLKIRTSLAQHKKFKTTDEVRKLRIQLKPATSIVSGIGESFRNLEKLDIGQSSSNSGSLRFIERADFKNMEQLNELGLNENPIEFFPEDVFWDLPELEGLHMWNCKIEKFPTKIFMNMGKLKKLYLGENKLTHLDKDLFKNNLQLERINMFANKLMTIDVDFTKLTKISWMSLFSNECINDRYIPNDSMHSTVSTIREMQEKIWRNCASSSL